jgi:hypothetical protein
MQEIQGTSGHLHRDAGDPKGTQGIFIGRHEIQRPSGVLHGEAGDPGTNMGIFIRRQEIQGPSGHLHREAGDPATPHSYPASPHHHSHLLLTTSRYS